MGAIKSLKRVRKRDGYDASFDLMKLAESIATSLAAVDANPQYAMQFSETVQIRLVAKDDLVTTIDLSKTVIAILREYGQPEAALAFEQYRIEETAIIDALRVIDDNQEMTPFDRSRLAFSFIRNQHMESSVARVLARRVERRLSYLAYARISNSLIGSLSDVESHTMGMRSVSGKSNLLGLERTALNAWLDGNCLPTSGRQGTTPQFLDSRQDMRSLLGEEVLKRFALEDVLNCGQVDSFNKGEYDFFALGNWLRPVRVWLYPSPMESEEEFWHRVSKERFCAHELQVHIPASFCLTSLSANMPLWLKSSADNLRFSTSNFSLALSWAKNQIWHSMPISVFVDAATSQQEKILELDKTILQWQPPAPLPELGDLEKRVLHKAIALNLPLIATQVNSYSDSSFLQRVSEVASLSCDALLTLLHRSSQEGPLCVALIPAGIDAAMSILYPDPPLRAAKLGQILLSLRQVLKKVARHHKLNLDWTLPPRSQSVGQRLADRDNLQLSEAYHVGWTIVDSDASLLRATDCAPWLELSPRLIYGSKHCSLFKTKKINTSPPSDDNSACT